METSVDTYLETRVMLAPSGELMLALPIYANQAGAFFNEDDTNKIAGVKLNIGMYEHIGYVAYHPKVGEFVLSKDCTSNGIEDLGLLTELDDEDKRKPTFNYTITGEE